MTAKIGNLLQKLPPVTALCMEAPQPLAIPAPAARSAVMTSHDTRATKNPCVFASRAVAACHLAVSSGVRGIHIRVVLANDPSSATRPTGRDDCNRGAMAGFAAAHG